MLLTEVSSASVQKRDMFLMTGLQSPVGAFPDDVVLRVCLATEETGGIVREQPVPTECVLPQITAVHMFVPEDPDTGYSGHDSGTGA